jgi:hypothetical protein
VRRILPLLAVLAAAALAGPSPALAQEGYAECADFTPESVRQACERAVPIECRGPDTAGRDFNACLRENGTSPEAVRRALDAAYAAAGIPVGGVDTGLGGLAGDDSANAGGAFSWPVEPALLVLAVAGAVGLGRLRRA